MADNVKDRSTCRVCNKSDMPVVLSLGSMPPANAFLKKEDLEKPEQKFPLDVCFCTHCGFLQLTKVVLPKHQYPAQAMVVH
jgi:hypothetical protein